MLSVAIRAALTLLPLHLAWLPLDAQALLGSAVPRVVLVGEKDVPVQVEVMRGVREHLAREGFEDVIEVDTAGHGAEALQTELAATVTDVTGVVVTLGTMATQAALPATGRPPVVGCMVLERDELDALPNATGVVLEFPVDSEFTCLRRVLPEARRIGVLFHTAANAEKIAVAAKVGERMGLDVLSYEVASPQDIPEALDYLGRRVDVIWGISDPVVVVRETRRPLLLFSFRERVPLFGLSEAWVKAGALAALERNYSEMAVQCAEMAVKVLRGVSPDEIPVAGPRKAGCVVNMKTARHMRMSVPEAAIREASQVFAE